MRARAYISALPSILKKNAEDEIYRHYTADTLKCIAENTAKYGGGGYMKQRYADIIHPKPEETRTSDEIISHMKEKLKRLGGEQNRPA
jgi:hypothetical protein